jgi:hypothetical protein
MTASASDRTSRTSDDKVIQLSHTASYGLVASTFFLVVSVIVVVLPPVPTQSKLLAAWFLAAAGTAMVVFSAMLVRKAANKATGVVYWLGIALIWLSTAFDVSATIVCSPDLLKEGNPVFHTLLDHGYPLSYIYACIAVVELLSCIVMSLCWAAVFRHRGPWLRYSFGVASSSFPKFCKAAMGGSALTWRQFIIPLHWSERPQCYPAALTLAAFLVVTLTLAHVRCGLEWVGLIPLVRWWILRPELVLGIATLLVWLAFCYRRFRTNPAAPAAEGGAK